MKDVLWKTFGGLSMQYYIRNFLFGSLFTALLIYSFLQSNKPIEIGLIGVVIVNTFLYPYSRFVYESIVSFILGDNVFFVNTIVILFVKAMTMALCWGFAVMVAPIGLIYLYFYHSKATT